MKVGQQAFLEDNPELDEELEKLIPKELISEQVEMMDSNSEVKYVKNGYDKSNIQYNVVNLTYASQNEKYFLCVKGP